MNRSLAAHKYLCIPCDNVVKRFTYLPNPVCPQCRKPMLAMGRIWKPGPKGDRFKHYPEGYKRHSIVYDEGGGYHYEVVVMGGRGYHPAAHEDRRWRPGGEKLRNRKGQIKSLRNVP